MGSGRLEDVTRPLGRFEREYFKPLEMTKMEPIEKKKREKKIIRLPNSREEKIYKGVMNGVID